MMRISVFCLVVLAFGAFVCGSENAVPHQQQPQPTAVRFALDGIPVPTPTTMIVEVPEAPEPGSLSHVDAGAATASLEERMYFADVVVKARLVSVVETGCTFQSIEYLKGTGPAQFTVRADTSDRDSRWDNQDAMLFLMPLTGATEDFEFIDTTAIVYGDVQLEYATTTDGNYVYANGIRIPSHLPNGQRMPSHIVLNGERIEAYTIAGVMKVYSGDLPVGHSVASRNPVWLPVETSGTAQRRSASGQQSSDSSTVTTDYDLSSGTAQTISGSGFRDTLSWLSGRSGTAPISGGNAARSVPAAPSPGEYTAAEVDNCLKYAIKVIRDERDHIAYFKRSRWADADPSQLELNSGDGRGVDLWGYERDIDFASGPGNQRYLVDELEGKHAHLFEALIIDPDNNSRTGFTDRIINSRPLPAGTYEIRRWSFPHGFKPCGFRPSWYFNDFEITSVAPPGTVHEAFFDPATTTAGVGYSAGSATTTGVLKPAGFSVRGRAIAITGLTWQNGRVVLTLDRFGSWLDGFSFIEPDGTVGLRLAEVDATEDLRARTPTWEASEQPWESGDELMLRIGPIPLPAVRNLTAERGSDREVVLRWEVPYRARVSGYRIWRHRPGRDEGPKVYVADTLSTDTTYTDANSPVPNLTEYRVQAIDRIYNAGESSESIRVGSQ